MLEPLGDETHPSLSANMPGANEQNQVSTERLKTAAQSMPELNPIRSRYPAISLQSAEVSREGLWLLVISPRQNLAENVGRGGTGGARGTGIQRSLNL